MKSAKMYIKRDDLSFDHNFSVYYADGTQAMSVQSAWAREKDKIAIMGRMGGEIAHIKPDASALAYYLRVGQYEYVLHTYHIFHEYFVEGMLWNVYGSIGSEHLDAKREDTRIVQLKVRPRHIDSLGDTLEVWAKDASYIQIAVVSVLAIAYKEHYRGLSEGIQYEKPSTFTRIKNLVWGNKGIAPEGLPDYQKPRV